MHKILIVDDDYAIRELYKYVFMDRGYQVETAKNGREGLDRVNSFKPDCMVIDISMPEMSGAEFARQLSDGRLQRTNRIPFVILTGDSQHDITLQYDFNGNPACKAFFSKLASPDTVVRKIETILENSPDTAA